MHALLAALAWGITPILEKTALKKIEPLQAVFLRSLAITTALWLTFCLKHSYRKLFAVDHLSILLIIAGGLLAGLLGQLFYFTALKNWDPSRVVTIAGSYPLIAFMLSVLLLGEQITIYKLAGVLLIIGGIILLRI